MLARVDGKSPAEYLTESERLLARSLAHALPARSAGHGGRRLGRARRGAQVRSTRIAAVFAWEALDSRGTPTVACEVRVASGASGVATVPSGASTGSHEARELRDGGERYGGRGVRLAVAAVNETIAPDVAGRDAADQAGLDAALRALDGTPDLSRLGANAVLAVSVAGALAAAAAEGVPLWRLLGARAASAAADGERDLGRRPRAGRRRRRAGLPRRPRRRRQLRRGDRVGGAGARAQLPSSRRLRGSPPRSSPTRAGWVSALPSNRAGLELLLAGIERAGLTPGDRGCDRRRRRRHPARRRRRLSPRDGGSDARRRRPRRRARGVVRDFPIVSLEDPLAEDDWPGWAEATRRLGDRVQLLGDDLFVTQVARLERGIDERVANAVLVKPNQCGTLTGCPDGARASPGGGLRDGGVGPLGRHGGRLARRPGGRLARRSDQGGLDDPLGANGQVEPPAAHRGGARRGRRRSPDATPWRGEREPQQAGGTPCGSASRLSTLTAGRNPSASEDASASSAPGEPGFA